MREKDAKENLIEVGVEWLGPQGFFVFLNPLGRFSVNPSEWRYRLLGWHLSSHYGTFVETGIFNGCHGFFLTPAMGLEFLSHPTAVGEEKWRWHGSALPWRQGASLLAEALAQGRWRPDPAAWQSRGWGWQVDWPQGGPPQGDGLPWQEWVDEIFREWTAEEGPLGQAWDALVRSYPLLGSNMAGGTALADEEWLDAVGWQTDDSPFRSCLRLLEPAFGNNLWRLETVLQERADEGHLVVWPEEEMPDDWREHEERIARERTKWRENAPWIFDPEGELRELTTEEAWRFLSEASLELGRRGCAVFLPRWWQEMQKAKARVRIKARKGPKGQGSGLLGLDQLVAFDWRVAIGDVELSDEEFRRLAEGKGRLMRIRDRWIQLDAQKVRQILEAMNKRKDGATFGDLLQAYLGPGAASEEGAEDQGEVPWDVEWDAYWEQVILGLTAGRELPAVDPPASFSGRLRSYQKRGMEWMLFLRQLGLGGCLADDMGLGKTIQWIAYLLKIREGSPGLPPSLLICPTSVLGNWQKELGRFAPSLRVYLHYGPQRLRGEALAAAVGDRDLVITTYALAHKDQADLAALEWDCICLDEAQNIKNPQTKQAAAVGTLRARHRLALTGTPMENRITELWSIMNFLNPGYLGSLNRFARRFSLRGEEAQDQVEGIRRLVRPFLLRRVKKDPAVELDLPDKLEMKEYVPLTPEQATLYENVTRSLFEDLDEEGTMSRRGKILAALSRLKQICDHPDLILGAKAGEPRLEASHKLRRLLEMVGELREEGDRCLIFTQYVEMGRIIQGLLERELGERVFFLHGGTPQKQRDEMVEIFQKENPAPKEACHVLVLSLKAGGVGLNLTAANHVFHYDRWWNPAVENQASDRAYRIGQKRHVQVHKLIALGTLEERIDEIIEGKQGLNELIVGGGEGWLTEFSTDRLREIFALRQEWISQGEEE